MKRAHLKIYWSLAIVFSLPFLFATIAQAGVVVTAAQAEVNGSWGASDCAPGYAPTANACDHFPLTAALPTHFYYYISNPGLGSNILYKTTLPQQGIYQVSYWMPVGGASRSSAVAFNISSDAGVETVTVNEQKNPGLVWVSMGNFSFENTTAQVEVLASSGAEFSIAGSIMFTYVGPVTDIHPVNVDGTLSTKYSLNWSDEFNGTSLDTTKWDYRTDSKGWSTQLPENVTVSDGLLHLNLKKQTANGMNYTGAGVISKAEFEYGYYEAKFRVPPGRGWHTSFWMTQYNTDTIARNQEIDVCEQDSISKELFSSGAHDWKAGGKQYGLKNTSTASDLSTSFHVWGGEFTATTVTIYLDGVKVNSFDATKFPHGLQNIWLTSIAIALGGTSSVDDTKLPASADFDYVRFFKAP